MENILISACLIGNPVRYDAGCLSINENDFEWLNTHVNIIPFCPEVSAGLPTPRAPAEIFRGQGTDVLAGTAKVIGNDDIEVTDEFIQGAKKALTLCQQYQIKFAILTENSPSCGSLHIYDGTFNGKKTKGKGVTTALLESHGIKVFNQHAIANLKNELNK